MMGRDSHRVSPFRNHRIVGCLAPPRCLSQLTASFIASQRQGIHLLPFDILFLKNFTIPFPFPYSIVNEQHPPVFPTGATRPCLDDCREIFASMTNHGLYVQQACGGGRRNRTVDPLRAKQMLSQLSYTP